MPNTQISATQLLFPVALIAFVVALSLGFQTTLFWGDRDALHQAYGQQDKLLEQGAKIKAQLNALAVGTLKLADGGNKDAQNIIAQLKKAGVDVSDRPNPPGQAMAPAAQAPAPETP